LHQPKQASYNIPEEWRWVLDIFDEAHLPHLALPVKWDKTREQHTKIIIDPTIGDSFSIETGKRLRSSTSSPVGFIKASK